MHKLLSDKKNPTLNRGEVRFGSGCGEATATQVAEAIRCREQVELRAKRRVVGEVKREGGQEDTVRIQPHAFVSKKPKRQLSIELAAQGNACRLS
jgi:hypothetical protein